MRRPKIAGKQTIIFTTLHLSVSGFTKIMLLIINIDCSISVFCRSFAS